MGNRVLPKAQIWSVSPDMLAAAVVGPGGGAPPETETRPYTEAVILEYGRPTLLIRNNKFELPESPELRRRLAPAGHRLEARLPSVGRIEFDFHPRLRWGGTGWMIAEKTIVTNRHVAEEFCARKGKTLAFMENFLGRQIVPRIDFREEYHEKSVESDSFEVAIEEILFLQDSDPQLPDLAFLRLKSVDGLPDPIPVSDRLSEDGDIAVVGYPARDVRGVESTEAARRIFGDIYDVKRLSPGKVLRAEKKDWFFTHDATTLGGNSGSVVLDLDTGNAIGLHFLGQLHEANYAVKGSALLDHLSRKKLKSTVAAPPSKLRPLPAIPDVVFVESTPEQYEDREGYGAKFLGDNVQVPLPTPTAALKKDLLMVGDTKSVELKYTHFSVVMSESRRMCVYSAVNIDGKLYKKAKRPGWRLDPRIPKEAQIKNECYGNSPKFARGHMTRREDPIWGDTLEEAGLGNSDSMHVTNAVPQMQPFNAVVWLGLESYALENARDDKMRISVFTGPFFTAKDPVRYDVQIPLSFWKVIAFIHDDTDKLCATGYTISQEDYLVREEFVFGGYETFQVPISWIEKNSRLRFGKLASVDPYEGELEGPHSL